MSPGGVFSLRDLQAITQKGPVFLGRQLKRIPQAFNLEPVGQRKLARLAGRYNKIPDRKKISTKQPVARFFEELGLNYAESAHVLRTYAKTLKDHPVKPRELDPALELILALTTGERRENIVIK